MKRVRTITLFLTLAMMFSLCTAAAAPEAESAADRGPSEAYIKTYVCNQVIESYEEYYTIPSISATVLSFEEKENVTSARVLVTFTKVLKAESAYDLPYIQGLQDGIAELTDPAEIASANAELEIWVNELEELYIGEEQTETAEFQVEIPHMSTLSRSGVSADVAMNFVSEFGTASMDDFRPASEDVLYANGMAQAQTVGSAAAVMSVQATSDAPSDPTDYDRVAARDYARAWTCNKSGCNPEYYNPAYTYFPGNDCSNYVSQCIHAGGIETEAGAWAPYTTAWTSVSMTGNSVGICEYMIDRGYFFDAGDNKLKAFAGSIICWVNSGQGHVGMVDQNDTVTMTYCGHTNDRLSMSFKNSTGVEFHVPVWDSHTGSYTPQS